MVRRQSLSFLPGLLNDHHAGPDYIAQQLACGSMFLSLPGRTAAAPHLIIDWSASRKENRPQSPPCPMADERGPASKSTVVASLARMNKDGPLVSTKDVAEVGPAISVTSSPYWP